MSESRRPGQKIIRAFRYIMSHCFQRRRISKVNIRPPLPTYVAIDPVNICNLKCPLCPTGADNLKYKKNMMSFKTFTTIINKMPSVASIDLFNWGEPFINSELCDMIHYATRRNIAVYIDTNFSFKKDKTFFMILLNPVCKT